MKLILFCIMLLATSVVSFVSGRIIFSTTVRVSSERSLSFDFRNSLDVRPQPPGTRVSVPLASLSTPGFLLFFRLDDHDAGEFLVASPLLPPGKTEHIVVPLPKALFPGDRIKAELHKDNGNKAFDSSNDDPIIRDDTGDLARVFYIR